MTTTTTEPTTEDRLARLRGIPDQWADPPADTLGKLPKPTRKNAPKGKCAPRSQGGEAPDWQDHYCGGWHGLPAVHLDYMGHADVTLALVAVDPEWSLDFGWESTAGPIDAFALTNPGDPTVLLARLTVLGVTRPCVGTVPSGKGGDGMKELIGDTLRNGAMRFGIGTALWSKAQREGNDPDAAPASDAPARQDEPDPWTVPMMKAKAMELAGGDKHLAAEVFDLTVGAVDGDSLFPMDVVVARVADMRELIARRASDDGIANPHDGEELIAPDGTDVAHGRQS